MAQKVVTTWGTRATNPSNLLVDFKYPLTQAQKSTNSQLDLKTKDRIWYSNPRGSADDTWEVLTMSMRKPIVVNHLSFRLLTKASTYEVWATTSDHKRSQVLTTEQVPLAGTIHELAPLAPTTWVGYDIDINPLLILSLEIRVRRTKNKNTAALFSLGISNVLLSRAIYTQEDTLLPIEVSVDILGNHVRKEVQDFRAELAIDDDSYTFWKSAPQPAPNAVVNFYCSVGMDGTKPKRIDRIWLDPVYTGGTMNLYYSNDPAIGKIRPRSSPISATLKPAITTEGLDLDTAPKAFGFYTGTLVSGHGLPVTSTFGRSGWIGLGIQAGDIFDSGADFPIMVGSGIIVNYSGTTKQLTATLCNPQDNSLPGGVSVTSAISLATPNNQITSGIRTEIIVVASESATVGQMDLRLIVGNSNSIISDTTATGSTFGLEGLYQDQTAAGGALGSIALRGPLGLLRAMVIKVATEDDEVYQAFVASPPSFVSPALRPVGTMPGNTLDNAIYVGSFMDGTYGYGGAGDELYTEKTWTPVWKDWTVQRGYFYLPAPIAATHLKLEFSKLTPQPYPIYQNGIVVAYKIFPLHANINSNVVVNKQTSVSGSTAKGTIARPSTSGLTTTLQRQLAPKTPVSLSSVDVAGLRNQGLYKPGTLTTELVSAYSKQGATTSEARDLASATVRALLSPSSAANEKIYSLVGSAAPIKLLSGAQATELTDATVSGSLGSRIPGWWILPGGQLQIPEQIMKHITQSSVITERPSVSSETSTLRTRFPTVSVHTYEVAQVVRDTALAYFAGLRGFAAFSLDYTVPVDSDQYLLTAYGEHTDFLSNVTAESDGSLLATRPTGPPGYNNPATLTTNTWNSIGTFIKASLTVVDRGLHAMVEGSAITADTPPSFTWDDPAAVWDDPVATWGSGKATINAYAETSLYFNGRQASKVDRLGNPTPATASVSSVPFSLLSGSRMQLHVSLYRPTITTNTFTLVLRDKTPITGGILASYPIDIGVGKWQEYSSLFTTVGQQTRVLPGVGLTSGSPLITGAVGSFRDYNVGQGISGPGIPAGVTILAVTNTSTTSSATLSDSATSTGTISVTFDPMDHQELTVTLQITGTDAETLYVADLDSYFSSIVYWLSNDNGATWYECTNIVNQKDGYLVFPTAGNALKVKVQMRSPQDYVYSLVATPFYLF